MSSNTIALRYALALFAVAKEQNKVDAVAEDLEALVAALRANPDFLQAFTHLQRSPQEKQDMLAPVLGQLLLEGISQNFVSLLFSKGRESNVFAMFEAYLQARRELRGEVQATVTAVRELSEAEQTGIVDLVKGLTGSQAVTLDLETDKSILGGLVLRVGDTVYDGSLARRLQALQDRLMQAQVKQAGVSS